MPAAEAAQAFNRVQLGGERGVPGGLPCRDALAARAPVVERVGHACPAVTAVGGRGEPGERQPVVLVDMDGTIADFDGRVYALMAASHPDVTPAASPDP